MRQNDDIRDVACKDIQERYKRLRTWRAVADEIGGVSPALCWKVAQGEYSLKMARALGLIPPRVRIAADVSAEQRDRLRAIAAAEGLTWSEYCRKLADSEERQD